MRTTGQLGIIVMLVSLAACGTEERGEETDVLPKRGETSTDPTIVSARAHENTNSASASIVIQATDPSGPTSLGTCMVDVAGDTLQANFFDGSCSVVVQAAWARGESHVVDVIVANTKGGVNSATVTVQVTDDPN